MREYITTICMQKNTYNIYLHPINSKYENINYVYDTVMK